jgi:hypothetical protein
MKPVDHVTPTVPGNWVRRGADKRRKREEPRRDEPDTRRKPGDDPDDRPHLIDELA